MRTGKSLAAVMAAVWMTTAALGLSSSEPVQAGQESAPAEAGPAKTAMSRVTAVTVYQGNALVTREVDVPAGEAWSRSSSRRCRLKRSTARSMPKGPTAFAS